MNSRTKKLLHPDDPSWALLDWSPLILKISSFAHFDSTKEIISGPVLARSEKEINRNYFSVKFFTQLQKNKMWENLHKTLIKLPSGCPLHSLGQKWQKKSLGTLDELNLVGKISECVTKLIPHLQSWNFCSQLIPERSIGQQFRRAYLTPLRTWLDEQGEIQYQGHPQLSRPHRELIKVDKAIRLELSRLLTSSQYSKVLQYPSYDTIYDHFVIPIKSEAFRSTHGKIISRSSSGQTLMVEPTSIRQLSNQRQELSAKLEERVNQLIHEFSSLCHQYSNFIQQMVDLIIRVDLDNAKAAWGLSNLSCFPELSPSPQIILKDFYHPLIANPVLNDIEMTEDRIGLLISGPNTGGKTAALKAITLCHLMLHMGLPIPAKEASLYPFPTIFYFGQDQQDLTQQLSSFSSEVKNYLQLFKIFGPKNLIVIDEIFHSTNSEEASALSLGLFREIHTHSYSRLLVSTHHEKLKNAIYTDKNYLSAHVTLDPHTQAPSYQLRYGSPGPSHALEIFRQIALKSQLRTTIVESILGRATGLVDKDQFQAQDLLKKLSQKNAEIDQLLKNLHRDEENWRKKIQTLEGAIRLKKQAEVDQEIQRLQELQRQMNQWFQRNKLTQVKAVSKGLSQWSDQVSRLTATHGPEQAHTGPPDKIEKGSHYYSLTLKRKVLVKEVDLKKKEVVLNVGQLTLRCPFHHLRPLSSVQGGKKSEALRQKMSPKRPVDQVQVQVDLPERDPILSLDGRGMRLEEFQESVQFGLNDLSTGRVPFLVVTHGHGTGVLKNWLRKFLAQAPQYKWEQIAFDSQTKIALRE